MYTLYVSLTIFAAVLLVLVVLAQNSKGGGLSSQFGGSSASNLIGVKKTGDLLERLTTREMEISSQAQDAISQRARASQQSVSGVNLDEEAANLMRYQQAYQASGKVIEVASTLFDTILSLGR